MYFYDTARDVTECCERGTPGCKTMHSVSGRDSECDVQ